MSSGCRSLAINLDRLVKKPVRLCQRTLPSLILRLSCYTNICFLTGGVDLRNKLLVTFLFATIVKCYHLITIAFDYTLPFFSAGKLQWHCSRWKIRCLMLFLSQTSREFRNGNSLSLKRGSIPVNVCKKIEIISQIRLHLLMDVKMLKI